MRERQTGKGGHGGGSERVETIEERTSGGARASETSNACVRDGEGKRYENRARATAGRSREERDRGRERERM